MGMVAVPKAGVWEVDQVWGVSSRDVEVLLECRDDHGIHFEGRGEWQLGCEGGVGANVCDEGVEEEGPGVRMCRGNG